MRDKAAPPLEEGEAWYVYCVLFPGPDLPDVGGIDGSALPAPIAEGQLAALASRVDLATFGQAALQKKLEDLAWLDEKVRCHEAVVEVAMRRGPVLPMKFCTIFSGPDAIRRVLREHATPLREGLDHVKDSEEWGVKGFSHRARLRQTALDNDPELREMTGYLARQAPGRAFFLRRRMDDRIEQRRVEREAELIRAATGTLRDRASAMVTNPPAWRQRSGQDEAVVLNLACLVAKPEVDRFLAAIGAWNEAHAGDGLRLAASGPWPPYNFSPRVEDHAA